MTARYLLVDVFAREPLAGNALAVFPDPGSVDPARMQKIAREMNLSETTFVTAARADGYDVRIFTPTEELPFAGHPTLGTAWVLRHLQVVEGKSAIQSSAAGETTVVFDGDRVWLERTGDPGVDLEDVDVALAALDIDPKNLGFDAEAIGGKPRTLQPAIPNAGVPQLMLPIGNPKTVANLRPPTSTGELDGIYCFAPLASGRIKARFFAPGLGVTEDPATGSAAANLGVYLGARAGSVSLEIEQGAEIGRPSFISLEAAPGLARVGGEVHLAAEANLVARFG